MLSGWQRAKWQNAEILFFMDIFDAAKKDTGYLEARNRSWTEVDSRHHRTLNTGDTMQVWGLFTGLHMFTSVLKKKINGGAYVDRPADRRHSNQADIWGHRGRRVAERDWQGRKYRREAPPHRRSHMTGGILWRRLVIRIKRKWINMDECEICNNNNLYVI